MHYDILSVLYQCYLRMDYKFIEKWVHYYNEDNVSGLIANLYFMNPEEMKNELGDNHSDIDVLEMFRISTNLFKKYLPNTKVLFSIEGCDYINDIAELEGLYKLGLRSILLVWNNPNKYGSGNMGDYGLTEAGVEFLKKAIDLGITIDLSHMNDNTFWDTIKLLKEQKELGKEVKVIASHSNSYELCPHNRNLDKEQILALKELDAVIGVVSCASFVLSTNSSLESLRKKYLEHIEYMVSLVGIDHVGISTDDMFFDLALFNQKTGGTQMFDYSEVKNELVNLLSEKFNEEEINKILYENINNKLF